MAINKVKYGSQTLIDLTADTVTADKLASGVTAHDKTGNKITGTMSAGGTSIPAPTAGSQPVRADHRVVSVKKTSLTDSTLSVTVPKDGTYNVCWSAFRTNTSGTFGTRPYVNGSAKGTENTSWTSSYYQSNAVSLSLKKGDVVKVYARSRSTSYYIYVSDLTLSVADNGYE